MDGVLLLLAAALLAAASYLVLKRKRFVDRVNALPGLKGDFLIGDLVVVAKHNFEVLSVCQTLFKHFAGPFRLWMACFPYVAVNTAENVEAVLSSMQHIDKSSDYSTLHAWLRFGLLTSTGGKWHARRRLLTPTFHFRILDQFVPVFNRNTRTLVESLAREADAGRAFNVSHYVHLCALDTICESAMGTMVDAQGNAESEYVNAVKVACCSAYQRMAKPWLYPDLAFYATPIGWSFRRALKVLHGLTESVIKARKKEIYSSAAAKEQETAPEHEDGSKRRVAFLDQLLLANRSGAGLSDIDIREEVDTFMFEGHDTTGTAISFALYELSKNPDVQELAFQEVSSIVARDRDVSTTDLSQMKYLERVIKETLRLYPSVPVFLRALNSDLRLLKTPGRTEETVVVPAGCTLFISPYMLHRDPALWPDPERFDPDRFLPERSAGRHAFAYVPFSAGPRNCIGQKYAMMEMKCMIARLLLEYHFVEARPGHRVDIVGELILKAKGDEGLLVRVLRRRAD